MFPLVMKAQLVPRSQAAVWLKLEVKLPEIRNKPVWSVKLLTVSGDLPQRPAPACAVEHNGVDIAFLRNAARNINSTVSTVQAQGKRQMPRPTGFIL